MLSLDDFKPVQLEDKPLFDEHYQRYPPNHSDNVFTTLISWKEYADYHFTFVEDNLIIYSNIDNQIRFRPPIGKRKKEIFNQVLTLAKEQGSDYPFGLVELEFKNWMMNNYPKIKFKKHRAFFDYVYLASDLTELKGSDYRKIRNRLNKFKKNFKYTVEKISDSNKDEIKEFLKRWCIWKDCKSDPLLEHERKAIIYSMNHFFDLKLSGIAIRVNGVLEAIAVYEVINPDTVVVHYEKGSPDYTGIYKAINQETARLIKEKYRFINRESDMGHPGLRKAKMSYKPHHMIEVYHTDRESISL